MKASTLRDSLARSIESLRRDEWKHTQAGRIDDARRAGAALALCRRLLRGLPA